MTASYTIDCSRLSASQTRNATHYTVSLWENIIELMEQYINGLRNANMGDINQQEEFYERLQTLVGMVPSDDFWERRVILNTLNNSSDSDLGIALIGLQRTCMGLNTINYIESRLAYSGINNGIMFQRSVCTLYTKAWFDDILRNAPFIDWEDHNENESEVSDDENESEVSDDENESEVDEIDEDYLANADTEIESGNETEEETDDDECFVACDYCGEFSIDPRDVTGSVAINLAEHGGGYIHEHCQYGPRPCSVPVYTVRSRPQYEAGFGGGGDENDEEESDNNEDNVQTFTDVVYDLLEDELLFGNEADIAIRDYERNLNYTMEAWTAYIFNHDDLHILAQELRININERSIIFNNENNQVISV